MHVEKNMCDSIIGTLLNIPDKTKDRVQARKDLVEMGICKQLALEQKKQTAYLPPACLCLERRR